jgi:stage V sporulation protein B
LRILLGEMVKESMKEKFVKNSIWNLSAAVLGRIGGLIFTIILARFLLPERYGIYSIVFSVAMIFYTFADLGINKTLIRYVAAAIAREKKKVSAYHYYLLRMKFYFTLIVSVALLILAYPLSKFVFGNVDLFVPMVVAAAFIFIFSFEGFYTNLFYSIEKVKYISIKEVLGQVLRIVLALVVVFFVSSQNQVIGIFFALIITVIVLLLFNLHNARKIFPEAFRKTDEEIDKKRVKKFAYYSIIASISGVFFSFIDAVMLGIFVPAEYVGFYRAAFALVFGIGGILFFPNFVILPILTKLKKKRMGEVFRQTFKYVSMFTIPSVFGLIVLGSFLIKILYGESYSPSLLSLYFLAPIIFLTVSVGMFTSLFSAEEKPQIFAKLIFVTSVLNIILNFAFIKGALIIYGDMVYATAGAAFATTISWVFYFFASIYYTNKEFNSSIYAKHILKPLFASIVMYLVLWFMIPLFGEISLLEGIFLIVEGTLIYTVVMFLIGGVKKEDFEVIRLLFKRH